MKTKRNKKLVFIDHTVTKEKFHLEWDNRLEMYITSPRPDEDNLGKYYDSEEYISHTDSKDSFIDKLYQAVKNFTIKRKVKLIEPFKIKDKSILDIGCGTGDFLVACRKNGWEIQGVEPNAKAMEISSGKLSSIDDALNRKVIFQDIQELIDMKKKYDVISMWHVLEHIYNLTEYIEQLKSLLNRNGVLIIAVPNFKSFDAHYYSEHWAAYDVPRHLWHFSKKSIKILFEKVGLKVIQILPMKFDAYYVSLLSEKYKKSKLNLLRAFYIGSLSNIKAKKTKEYSSLIYIIKEHI